MIMKKMKKQALGMVTTGATLGFGSAVLSKVPHTANAQTAVGNMSGFMPIAGTISGAGAAISMTGGLSKMVKRKRAKKRKK